MPDTPTATNNHIVSNINTIMQEFQELASHAQFDAEKQTTGCIVCGKSYEVIEEKPTGYLQQAAEPGETKRERHLKRQVFIVQHQSGVKAYIFREVQQAAACDGLAYKISNGNTTQ